MTLPEPFYADSAVTIYHADCRDVLSLLSADVMVTDPPYGNRLRSGWNGAFGDCHIAGDEDPSLRDEALSRWEGPAVVFGRWSVPHPERTRMVLTWEKGEHVGMGDLSLPWKPNTEQVYVIGSGFRAVRRGGSVLRYHAVAGTVGRADQGTRHHPMEKPIGLMRDLVSKCPPGVIVDPFMGSGTTLRAAKDLGRTAIGIEADEAYCRVAADRMRQEVLDFGGAA